MSQSPPTITADLVRRLVDAQFPHYARLPVTPVEPGGNDNRTFRLGEELSARLPSAAAYVAGIEKEQHWLPHLAPHLPVSIPTPIALGAPSEAYPWPWSIKRWMGGSDALSTPHIDKLELAKSLSRFLAALQAIPAANGPAAGEHSFFRGASLSHYDAETREAIRAVTPILPAEVVSGANLIWEKALASERTGRPVWFHGDLAPGNILIQDGVLSGVIDFGTCGVGDPACDLAIAWTFFDRAQRPAFANAMELDAETWARGRGWALWKALITLADRGSGDTESRRVIAEVTADPMMIHLG